MPDSVSVSQITTFLQCPRKYRFRYVEKREPEVRSGAMAFGSAVHSAIAWWQHERMAGRTPSDEDALRIFRADWLSQMAPGGLNLDGKTPEELQVLGETLLRLFLDRFRDEVPEAVETHFEVPLRHPRTGAKLPVPLVGFLDARSDGLLTEIKTTSRKTAPADYLLQLSAYAYAVREQTGLRPRVRVVELVKTKQPKIEVQEIVVSDRDCAWFVEVAGEVLAAIEAGAYFPNPSWACPRCEYRQACQED